MIHFFYGGVLSQWYKSKFIIDDITYNCAEQYMMAKKAMLFNDDIALIAIMKADHPRDQKALGRLVDNFDVDVWNVHCRQYVYEANFAKFTQNSDLREFLISTNDKELVEASPTDRIWGIGLGMDDSCRFDKDMWRGTNWLGEELMRVRESINQMSISEYISEHLNGDGDIY